MRGRLLAVVMALLLSACDSGEGNGQEEQSKGGTPNEDAATGGGGSGVPQCTTHKACEWGELCLDKICQVPVGQVGEPAWDFSRPDECPGSATYQKDVVLSERHASVVLLYFATSTCAACVADAKVYESMVKQLEYKGFVGVATMITVLLPNSGSAIATFSAGLQFPVIVDTTQAAIAEHYNAGKDTVVLIDGAGYVRYSWPALEVRAGDKDKGKLNTALTELANELL